MTILECVEALSAHNDVLILTHARPDGDTLGSAAALCSALRRAGKTAALYPNPEITAHFMDYVGPYLGTKTSGGYVVSIDVAEEKLFPKGFEGTTDLAIDHHPKNPGFAADGLLLDGAKASCGEIVMQVIKGLCGGISKEEADLLYLALSTDCGCFQYGNTKADTHIAAAELIDCGVPRERIRKYGFAFEGREVLIIDSI